MMIGNLVAINVNQSLIGGGGSGQQSNWILTSGFWQDNKVWTDNENWID